MAQDDYRELDSVQLENCEVVISSRRRSGLRTLVIAPRRTFVDSDTRQRVAFIPKRSSIEFSSAEELDEFLEAMIRIRNEGIVGSK